MYLTLYHALYTLSHTMRLRTQSSSIPAHFPHSAQSVESSKDVHAMRYQLTYLTAGATGLCKTGKGLIYVFPYYLGSTIHHLIRLQSRLALLRYRLDTLLIRWGVL